MKKLFTRIRNYPFLKKALKEEWHTAFRYATGQEIEDYKTRAAKKKQIEKLIKEKQQEISELYKQL